MPKVNNQVVLGLRDVRSSFQVLPSRLAKAILRRGLRDGAKVVGQEARRRAPQPPAKSRKGYSRQGNLKKAIKWETRGAKFSDKGVPAEHRAVVYVARPGGKGGRNARRYAHLVEFGTMPHAVGRGSIRKVFARSKAKVKQVGGSHPGTKAQPFMRPAMDTKKYEAVKVIADRTRADLQKELAKMKAATPAKGRR